MQLIYNIVRTTTESERCMYNCTKKSKYASIKKVSSKNLKAKKNIFDRISKYTIIQILNTTVLSGRQHTIIASS